MAATDKLTWNQVIAWRYRRHHLDEHVPADQALPVARRLCGLHAQLMASAELTLWARVEGLAPAAVSQALWKDRTLVKTWAMRGTLHLLAAADYPVWQAALSTYKHYLKPSWFRAFGLTPAELERLLDAIAEALDGDSLTREELGQAVTRITRSAELGARVLGSWGSFLKPASFRGRLCFGPSAGQNVRFTRPDRWLGPLPTSDPHEATLQVVRWFLEAHGPASREDLARWWAISPAQALKVLKELGDEATPVDVEGYPGWMLTAHVAGAKKARAVRSVRLLPAFDQYVIAATRHVAHLLTQEGLEGRIHRPQGWISPVLAVDGKMAGVWKHERKGSRLEITIEPFADLPARVRKAAEQEGERLGGFLGGTPAVNWAT